MLVYVHQVSIIIFLLRVKRSVSQLHLNFKMSKFTLQVNQGSTNHCTCDVRT